MADRDKFVELIRQAEECPPEYDGEQRDKSSVYHCEGCKYSECTDCMAERVADYLIANGVICMPCKVGDTVYYFSCDFGTILPYFVENLNIAYLGEKGKNYVYTFEANCNHENELLDSIDFEPDDIGKTVFFTEDEAKNELERSNNNG